MLKRKDIVKRSLGVAKLEYHVMRLFRPGKSCQTSATDYQEIEREVCNDLHMAFENGLRTAEYEKANVITKLQRHQRSY
jgi:hypothetical protein